MRFLVLNRFNVAATRYAEMAGQNAEVVLVTDSSQLPTEPADRERLLRPYADVTVFAEYDDNPEIETFCLRKFQGQKFDRVIALSETDILRAARIREWLGVPGQGL